MKRSRNVYLIGPMGAGKSTIGRHLAELLKMEFYDSDAEIESRCGADIAWIFDLEGPDGFRKREEKIIHELTELNGVVLATGGGVVASPLNRTRLAARGTVVYLKVTVDQQMERTAKDKTRPLLQVDNKREVLEKIREDSAHYFEDIADYIIQTDERGVRTVAADIVKMLQNGEG
jgi:shikimate kinase